MYKDKAQVLARRGGSVVRVVAEVQFAEYQRFVRTADNLGVSKKQAVEQALNYWMNSLPDTVTQGVANVPVD